MTGIRNYLVKHGEGELEDLIEHERARLKQDEILNIDNIIERSLHICVLHPLKLHIYNLFVTEYTRLDSLCHELSALAYLLVKFFHQLNTSALIKIYIYKHDCSWFQEW